MIEELKYLNQILKDDDTIVVALSGGPDSMCLLYLLLEVRKEKRLNLIAAHVNHNVRVESKNEAIFVRDYCSENQVAFETMTIEEYSDDNFENEARNIRYNYFENIIRKYRANYLMTAHHGDDLIETILMRIGRGSILSGYAGFKKEVVKKDYKLIRPLITTTKKKIEEYNDLHHILYAIDKTNLEDIHTRNRYRHHVLNFLKNEDKDIHKKYLKFSNTLIKYSDYINKITLKHIKKMYVKNNLDLALFNKLDELIQTKVIEYILESIYHDDLILITDIHTSVILDLIKSKKDSGELHLPNNLVVRKNYGKLNFKIHNEKIKDYEIEINSEVSLPNDMKISLLEESDEKSNYVVRLSFSEVTLPLYVRNRKPGDKMEVKKLKGSKKINDIFIDSKVELPLRKTWPVVCDAQNRIVWLPGLKKSKFDKEKNEKYDIILKYQKRGE